MATSGPTALPAFLSNDADFRTWAQGVHDAIIAVGLVQTADTGQINFSTVAKPAATNTAGGYTVYRFDDALQATAPVFIKLEWGVGGAVDRPSIWPTVGTGSNGSGTITGNGARVQRTPNASKTAGVTLTTYVSGNSGRLSLITNDDNASQSFGVGIFVERLLNSSGVGQSDGIFTYSTNINGYQFQIVGTSIGVLTAITANAHPFFLDMSRFGAHTVWGARTSIAGAHIPMGTWYRSLLCLADQDDVTKGTSIQASNAGATRTLMPVGVMALAGNTLLMPWE